MALKEFFKDYPQLKEACTEAAEAVETAYCDESKYMRAESVTQAHTNFLQALTTAKVLHILQNWKVQRSKMLFK